MTFLVLPILGVFTSTGVTGYKGIRVTFCNVFKWRKVTLLPCYRVTPVLVNTPIHFAVFCFCHFFVFAVFNFCRFRFLPNLFLPLIGLPLKCLPFFVLPNWGGTISFSDHRIAMLIESGFKYQGRRVALLFLFFRIWGFRMEKTQ